MESTNRHFFISLVRHGETDENCKAIIQGQANTKLNSLGRLQAQQLAKHLKPKFDFDLIYSSDLARAYETAQILVLANEDGATTTTSNLSKILTDVRIRERSFGSLEGQSVEVLRKLANDAGKKLVEFTPDGGETLEDVSQRAVNFLEDRVLSEVGASGQKVLLVAHGGVIREIITYFASFGHESLKRPKAMLIPPNTSVSQFKVSFTVQSSARIVEVECLSLHDIGHLNEEIQQKALNQKQINDGVSI